MDAAELAAVLAPVYALLAANYREQRLARRAFAREVPVVRGYLENIAKATGAPSPTFPPPPPPRSPDDSMETPTVRLPRILPVLLALALSLPLAGCVSVDRGVTFEPVASSSELLAVKAYATEETSTLRRELEAAEARVRADMDAADARVRADVVGQVDASNAAWSKAVAEGRSFAEAAADAAAAVAGKARADADRAATLATEAGSRSADALKRADAAAASRREELEEVLERFNEGKIGWIELVGAVLTGGGAIGYTVNRHRNATRAAALAAATGKAATSPPAA